MPLQTISPPRPYVKFVNDDKSLSIQGYDFLYGMYRRVGGSLSALDAVYLGGQTWAEPSPIGITTPQSGKFTTLQATGAFACNGLAVQPPYIVGATLGAYAAGANGLSTAAAMQALVNKVIALETALKANGICITI